MVYCHQQPNEGSRVNAADRLLTPSEVGEHLGIHVTTAQEWLRSGRLPAVKLGRRGLLRMRESDLETYIAELKTLPKREPGKPGKP